VLSYRAALREAKVAELVCINPDVIAVECTILQQQQQLSETVET